MPAGIVTFDSSVWIEFLRPQGDPAWTAFVHDNLQRQAAVIVDVVYAEILRGTAHANRRAIQMIYETFPAEEMTRPVWHQAFRLIDISAAQGMRFPLGDVLIAATCTYYGYALATKDRHFDAIQKLLPELDLVGPR